MTPPESELHSLGSVTGVHMLGLVADLGTAAALLRLVVMGEAPSACGKAPTMCSKAPTVCAGLFSLRGCVSLSLKVP